MVVGWNEGSRHVERKACKLVGRFKGRLAGW